MRLPPGLRRGERLVEGGLNSDHLGVPRKPANELTDFGRVAFILTQEVLTIDQVDREIGVDRNIREAIEVPLDRSPLAGPPALLLVCAQHRGQVRRTQVGLRRNEPAEVGALTRLAPEAQQTRNGAAGERPVLASGRLAGYWLSHGGGRPGSVPFQPGGPHASIASAEPGRTRPFFRRSRTTPNLRREGRRSGVPPRRAGIGPY